MKADLHVHSDYSDGYDSIETILDQAKRNGIEMISFVDHDTTDTYPAAKKAGEGLGIIVIPGIEISAYDFKRNRKVHIIGYNYDYPAVHINDLCGELLKRRDDHSWIQVETLIDNGYTIRTSKLKKSKGNQPTLYKQHIMESMTDAPYGSAEYKTLYRALFKGDGICASDIEYIDANLAVKAIKADGGLPVLAHPGQLDSFDIIPELVKNGLAGLEINHPDHSEVDQLRIKAIAEQYGLFLTGGSDYHGNYWIPLEVGHTLAPEGAMHSIVWKN